MDAVLVVLAVLVVGLLVLLGASVRVVNQFERGVVLRFGRLRGDPRGAGPDLHPRRRSTGCTR